MMYVKWRDSYKTDCYFYVEDIDMGAHIPWCTYHHQIISSGECAVCDKYCSGECARRIVLASIEEEQK